MLNNIDEIYQFSGLDTDTVQPSEIQTALSFASDLVTWLSPEDETDRSDRASPLRKRAEAYLCTAELYRKLAPFLLLTTPGKQVLTTLNISIGTDLTKEGPGWSDPALQTRQIRGTLNHVDMAIPSQAHLWEGVETCRRASHAEEGKVQTTNLN